MLTTLTIKKKYLYFFLISIILSILCVIFFNSNHFKNIDPLSEKCENYDLKVDYYYTRSWGAKGDSVIHNILKEHVFEEINFRIGKDNFEFDGENIYFVSGMCEEHNQLISKEFDVIYETVLIKMLDLYTYLDEHSVNFSIYDEHIFYSLKNEKAFELTTKEEILSINQSFVNIIKFLFVLLFLNLIYFLYINVNIKIR